LRPVAGSTACTSRSSSRYFRIGRDEVCELQLDDPLISRRHAEAQFDHGRWWLVDLQSRNGTRLDGQLVERAPLPPTCSVKLYEGGPALILEVRGPSLAALTVSVCLGLRPAD
jgi:predicted component of type VI protein secretion system